MLIVNKREQLKIARLPPTPVSYLSPLCGSYFDGILPKGPYLPCLRMADRALLAGNPRCITRV